ncbi:PBECR4 domain-containing protein [uncultured Gemmiger sp.]|uniref:PBECR4 domain-containing protein n=1 Tax=uncultured Gemmiger sp. TaxID=1623490 RepID=UPI0025ED99EC|nr:PBECR4 domain-containing protein [uncultured Gemmiger sp.]
MSKKNDKEHIVKEICKAAKLYKANLVGKRFLYVFDGRYIEVLYKNVNFKHLTGVECNMSAADFYKNALKNRLQSPQIYFSASHPYSLCKRKIKHLCEISVLASSENFMLEEIATETRTYKFGTTDLNFSLCMNKEYDSYGNEKGDCYIVESLRDEDCFSRGKSAYTVTHILSKDNDSASYTDLLFMDKSVTLDDLPAPAREMLDGQLLASLAETNDSLLTTI